MWHRHLLPAAALAFTALSGCAQSYDVRTMAAPKTTLTEFHTFHLLSVPRRVDGRPGGGSYDPMVNNSITNRALRETVNRAFQDRGYVDVEWMPDFVVAIYATTHERLDLSSWSYSYHHSQQWWSMTLPDQVATLYPEGTVIVDVVSPETLDVLWRGSATIALDHDPLENAREIVNAASAIMKRFPRAMPIVVASR